MPSEFESPSPSPSPSPAPAPAPAPAVDEFRVIRTDPAPAPAAPVETPPAPPAEPKDDDKKPDGKEEIQEEVIDASGEKARKPSAQDRIDELTRARRSAEREAEYWRGRANEGSALLPKTEPDRATFESESDYVKEMSAWTVEQAKAAATATTAEQMAQNSALNAWNAKVASARQEIPDYDAVMQKAELPVSNDVANIIRRNSQGPAIAYELAKQPELLEQINTMDTADAAIEIGKLLSKRSTPPVVPPKPSQRVTNAPDPLTEKVTSGNTVPVSDPSKMSMEEYRAYRQKQGAWWSR